MPESHPRSSEKTRERILDAARDTFSSRGIEAVSVREVAKAAGVSHALVHTYFGSKNDLVDAVLERELTGFGHILQSSPADSALQDVAAHGFGNKDALMLFLRAQMDGYEPHRFLTPDKMAIGVLAARLKDSLPANELSTDGVDPRAAIATIGAASLGMAAAIEPLMAAVGLPDVDREQFEAQVVAFMAKMVSECLGCDAQQLLAEAAGE